MTNTAHAKAVLAKKGELGLLSPYLHTRGFKEWLNYIKQENEGQEKGVTL
jgi:hypothetical protein